MLLVYFFEGILIGFVGAMPVGPIAILCIQHAASAEKKQGIVIGMAGALADCVYSAIALLGITVAANFVVLEQHLIQLCGGMAVIVIGFVTFRSHPSSGWTAGNRLQQTRLFVSIFLLALTNPVPLIGFAAFLSALGIGKLTGGIAEVLPIIAGIFLGSLGWFMLLTSIGSTIRRNITSRKVSLINKTAGITLAVLGLVAACSSLLGL